MLEVNKESDVYVKYIASLKREEAIELLLENNGLNYVDYEKMDTKYGHARRIIFSDVQKKIRIGYITRARTKDELNEDFLEHLKHLRNQRIQLKNDSIRKLDECEQMINFLSRKEFLYD